MNQKDVWILRLFNGAVLIAYVLWHRLKLEGDCQWCETRPPYFMVKSWYSHGDTEGSCGKSQSGQAVTLLRFEPRT